MRKENSVSPKANNTSSLTMTNFRCEVCGVKFYRKGHLTVHMRIHSSNKRYPCEYCDAKFTQKGSYQAHKETHYDRQGYYCPLCEKRYAHQSSLDSHLRSHDPIPQFICSVCGAHFMYENELNLHLSTHPERRVVSSSQASARSSTSGAARTIALDDLDLPRIPHNLLFEERVMACEVCGSRFTNEAALHAHKRFHRSRPSSEKEEEPRKKRRRRLSFNASMCDVELEQHILDDDDAANFMGIIVDGNDDSFVHDISDVGDLELTL